MRWRSAEVRAGGAGAIVSLAGGETEGFAAARAAAAAVAGVGRATGDGFGDAAGVGDARSQLTKPVVGVDVFSRFAPGAPKGAVVSEDEIDDPIARLQGVLRQLAGDAGRLHGNDRRKPCDQNANGKKGDREKRQNRLRPPQSVLGHFCDQRIEEIGEDDSDRHRNQDRLKESDHVGRDPDDRARYRNERDDEERGERSPHRLALPGCGIFCHSLKGNTAGRGRVRRAAFEISLSIDLRRRALAHCCLGFLDLVRQ